MNRRRFIQSTALGSLATFGTLAALGPAARAIEPFVRKGPPRLRLGLAAYSFRDYFKDSKHPRKAGVEPNLDMFGFIDYCAEHGVQGAELTSYYFPKDVTDEQLRAVRRHAFLRGVSITGTSVGNNFAQAKGPKLDAEVADVKRWIDRAAVLGAPHIRVFAGPVPKDISLEEGTKNCIAALKECLDSAAKHGIFLGLENHGGIVAEPDALLAIVKEIDSPWLGINLDSGNFHTEDPYASLAKCAPYAVNVQIKTEMRPKGAKDKQASDLPRLVSMLRESGYQGWVTLEYEAAEDPWKAVPATLAQLAPLLAAPASAAAEWTPLFDGKTLDGWTVTEFSPSGEVSVKDGAIVLGQGDGLSGVTIKGEPPHKIGYEIALEAMRTAGTDFFCGLTLPYEDSFFTFIAGGWGGSLIGISSIDDQHAAENETTQFKQFLANKWYRIRLRVEKDSIHAWIDDEEFVKLKVDGRKISLRLGDIEASAPLGIATYHTGAKIRDVRIRKL